MEQRNPILLLGAKQAMPWQTHLLFLAISMLSALVFDQAREGGPVFDRIGFALIGFLVVALPLVAASRPIAKLETELKRSLAWSAALLAVGFLRGFVLLWLGTLWGLVPEQETVYRVMGAPIFVFSVYLVGNAVLTQLAEHDLAVAQLERERQDLERQRIRYSSDLRLVDQAQRAKVRELLAPAIDRFQSGLENAKNPADLREALIQLQTLNNEVVRPMSSELSTSQLEVIREETASSTSKNWLPKTTTMGADLEPWVFALTMAVVGPVSLLSTNPTLPSLLSVVVSLLWTGLAFILLRLLLRRRRTTTLRAAIQLVASGFTLSGLGGWLLQRAELINQEPIYPLQIASYFTIAIVSSLLYGAAKRERFETLANLAETNSEMAELVSLTRQKLWVGQRSLAMELHGSVQGTIQAVISRLGKMAEIDPEQISESVRQIRSALLKIENQDYLGGKSFEELSGELVELWEGAVEIKLELYPEAAQVLRADGALARCAFEVVREATTNAAKHGEATEVAVDLWVSDARLVIKASNNGNPVATGAELKSKLFDELCLNYEVRNQGESVEFYAELMVGASF